MTLTHDIPGIGGRLRDRPEDFLVEEIPLYEPSGTGEHIYIFIEKRNLTTFEAIDAVARHFGVPRAAVGYAGLKDRVAITRQVLSVHVPGRKIEDFPLFSHERIAILWADYHDNKLRRGHLRGNRFSIRVRGVPPMAVRDAKRTIDRLTTLGVPNRVGEQRFGSSGLNHLVARAIVLGDDEGALALLLGPVPPGFPPMNPEAREAFARGDYAAAMNLYPRVCHAELRALKALSRGASARSALRAIDRREISFFMSALQSNAFNRVLDRRIAEGSLGELRAGDIAMKHENRAMFAVDEATASDPSTRQRLDALEISPTGPMWGPSMMRAAGPADQADIEALAQLSLTPEILAEFAASHPGLIEGERRALRVPLGSPELEGGVDDLGPFVRVAFDLPRGAFATAVMREIMKADVERDDPTGSDQVDPCSSSE